MKRMHERLLKGLTGLLLMPGVFAFGLVLWKSVDKAPFFSGKGGDFALGVCGYLFMHTLLWEPVWLYVLGHELTHALFGLLFFARITGFKVNKGGGSVTVSKSNFLISLGPYLIPFYTLLVCVAFLFVRSAGHGYLFIKWFLMATGFTWALHLVMTVKFIRMKQPDLIETGSFFSLALIALINIVVLAGILSWAIPGFSFIEYTKQAVQGTQGAYLAIIQQLFL